MMIAAQIIGVLFLLFWLLHFPIARRHARSAGSVQHATVFQFNILPFIIGIVLILYGSLLFLIIFPIAWVLSRMFPNYFMFIFTLAFGWIFGSKIFSDFFPNSKVWFYSGGIIGLLFMFVFCTVVVAIITNQSYGIENDTDEQKE